MTGKQFIELVKKCPQAEHNILPADNPKDKIVRYICYTCKIDYSVKNGDLPTSRDVLLEFLKLRKT